MPNKTIYIRDEDVPLFEQAQKTQGESLSAVVTQALRSYISASDVERSAADTRKLIQRTAMAILEEASEARATMILFEPARQGGSIRIRIDGSLRPLREAPEAHYESLINFYLQGARLRSSDYGVKDGLVSFEQAGETVDYQLNLLPAALGPTLTLRPRRPLSGVPALDQFEPEGDHAPTLERLAALPRGLIIVTGPGDSGKTTTLYALLQAAARRNAKIMSVEDPVETIIPGCIQIPLDHTIGFTFAPALRVVLRSDPDVVMAAEIRDQETARICVELAVTGRLVLFALHAPSAAHAITRLLELGIEPFLLRDALAGVVSQRLLRKLCDRCKSAETTGPEARDETASIFLPVGCEDCEGTGFRGRLATFEILEPNAEIKALIGHGPSTEELEARAVAAGMQTLRDDAEAKLRRGWTPRSEIARVLP